MNTPNDIQGKHVVLTSRSPFTQLTEQAELLKVIAVGDIKYMRRFLWEVEKLADFCLGEGTALYPVRRFLRDTLLDARDQQTIIQTRAGDVSFLRFSGTVGLTGTM